MEALSVVGEPVEQSGENSIERLYVESLVARSRAGERLAEYEEAIVAYSPYGTASGCSVCGSQIGATGTGADGDHAA